MPGPENDHLTTEEIHELLGDLQEPVERRLLFHALGRCATCRDRAPGLLDLLEAGRLTLEASLPEIEVALAETEAPHLWAELEARTRGLPPAERRERLREHPGLAHWGLAVKLAEDSLERCRDDVDDALAKAELAVAAADGLESDERTPPEYLAELGGFVRAVLAFASWRGGEPDAAERALAQALLHLDRFEEPADFLPFRPRVLELLARLRYEQGRLRDAWLQIDRALEAAEGVHRPQAPMVPRILRWKARILGDAGSWEEALEVQERAAREAGETGDSALRLEAELERLELLLRLDRLEEAEASLRCVRRLMETLENVPEDAPERARLVWAQARIDAHRGRFVDAEAGFRRALALWETRARGRQAARVLLDLARGLLARGQAGEIPSLAALAGRLVENVEMDREARAVLELFRAAVHWDGVSLEPLLDELGRQLDRHPFKRFTIS